MWGKKKKECIECFHLYRWTLYLKPQNTPTAPFYLTSHPLARLLSHRRPRKSSQGCIKLSLADKAGSRKYILPHRQNSGDIRWTNICTLKDTTHTHTHKTANKACCVMAKCCLCKEEKYVVAPVLHVNYVQTWRKGKRGWALIKFNACVRFTTG